MDKIWAVVRREFVERVRQKWFWVMALLGPVFFAGLFFLPILLARGGGIRHIAVVDGTAVGFGSRIVEALGTTKTFRAVTVSPGARVLDSLTDQVNAKTLDGFLIVADSVFDNGKAEYRASNVSSIQAIEDLERLLSRLIVKARLERAGVNPVIVDQAQIRIDLETKKISRGQTTGATAGGSFFLAYIMAILLFITIFAYGANVMSSVLEEKTTRIVEVLVSSLRPFQLMLGKVLGVGAVSIFQFMIWGVSGRLLLSQRQALVQRMTGESASAGPSLQLPAIPPDTIAVFLAFFLGGFLLYSSMFAAVGAMSSNEQEARQAQQPVMYLLMISYLSIFGLTNDPNSTLSVSLSLIPFTSPIAMPVRWTAGSVGARDLVVSLSSLVLAIIVVTWVASRIYRVGILMTGKRPSIKELVRWVRAA
jgi:ABC-2 type transport system permease protein